jgi:linoleoyl-CoA desaturase
VSGRGTPSLWLKTVLILSAYAAVYAALVWAAAAWWQAVPLAILLGIIAALIGFNIQHDGGHQAYGRRAWQNRLAAATLDLIGASSYLWQWKHAVFHHGFTNVPGQDTDIDVGRVLRLEPGQPLLAHHRWQHLYIWLLYGLMAPRWQLYDDFREVLTGRIGPHSVPRPKGRELTIFIAGKVIFITLIFGIPLCFHPWWEVVLLYGLSAYSLGFTLSIVFQLAHNTGLVEFPQDQAGRLDRSWAEHQLATTADFSPRSPVLTWFLGGLNFQIEHHLFPHISHVHYPALAPIVAATCRTHDLTYRTHHTFIAGLAAHYAWLRAMGRSAAR